MIDPRPSKRAEIITAAWSAGEAAFKDVLPPGEYMRYVLSLLFLKYLSDLPVDGETEREEPLADPGTETTRAEGRFVVPAKSTVAALCGQRHIPGNGARIDAALDDIAHHNSEKLNGAFKAIRFSEVMPGDPVRADERLGLLLGAFSKPALNLVALMKKEPEAIGEIFESLLDLFAAAAGRAEDPFHTSPMLATLVAHLVAPGAGETVYDPTCGSGSLLTECGRYVRRTRSDRDYVLYGQDKSEVVSALAKLNLLIHGEDHYDIAHGDVIRNPKHLAGERTLRRFDVVVSAPPYSVETWAHEVAENDPFGRFEYGIPPKTRGNFALILQMVASMMRPDGRAAVVVPQGVLFRGASEAEIRQKLIQDNLIDAVIGLPEKLLYNAPIAVSILVMKTGKTDKNVLFVDASDGYTYGRTQNTLGEEHIDAIVEAYANRRSIPGRASLVSNERVLVHEGCLSVGLYVSRMENPIKDVTDVSKERERIQKTIGDLDHQITETLRRMGYES